MGYSQKLITLEKLQAEYDSKAILGLIYACTLLPVILLDSDSEWDVDSSMQDGGPPTGIVLSQKYKIVLKRMLPMFEEKGVFRLM